MNDYLILFENMLGVVAMRKHLMAAGQPFTVTDIPPSLGKACGLGIRLSVSDDSLPALRDRPQVTEIYRCEAAEYILTAAE
ncbi:putative Se/S carrier-like protein [Morganella morganii]|uniref:putative Se/S carrier-like protein n=1 Tax=Morganella morganii TaxID=582 RepID=UPI001968272C|nr:putative Se/S carrier-like protein [Morganella morganii]